MLGQKLDILEDNLLSILRCTSTFWQLGGLARNWILWKITECQFWKILLTFSFCFLYFQLLIFVLTGYTIWTLLNDAWHFLHCITNFAIENPLIWALFLPKFPGAQTTFSTNWWLLYYVMDNSTIHEGAAWESQISFHNLDNV